MRAVMKLHPGPGATLCDVERPTPGPGEILIKVAAAAICGTDSHIYDWNEWAANAGLRVPGIIGHEAAGEVVALGPGVTAFALGDRVSVETHIPCNTCYQCLTGAAHICQNLKLWGLHTDGCFAEYAIVPTGVAWRLPATIPWEQAALFEPAGVALHGLERAEVGGRDVAVVGCGPIGLYAVMMARALGAARIFALDIAPGRLELAVNAGATRAINPAATDPAQLILSATGGRGVDAVIESSGSGGALRGAFSFLRKGGRVVLLGLPAGDVPLNIARDLVFREATVIGVHGRQLWQTWLALQELVALGRVDLARMVTHRLDLAEFDRGFELARQGATGKVLLLPHGG